MPPTWYLEPVMDGQDLVDVDPYAPAEPETTIPVHRWRQAPKGLATRRQLRERRLRPGGQDPVAVIECRGGKRMAFLYEIKKAKPIRPMTFAMEVALDKAMAARQTCPKCSRRYYHCLPLRTLGSCLECYDGTPAAPDNYLHHSVGHLAAA
ncbi:MULTISPECIES: RRQRL motif-containing zinc-binding protein [unclassified Streptomyces]|uniref:RRQRL motif-containing zinc-binding protein n=1 Tax=unclassified Streptomyces TaxID=2593676 RepID=UPI0027E43125|nr:MULTISPECIES: RRQRL motif-containing zinc-binding protein [unclassified Streptomyces]